MNNMDMPPGKYRVPPCDAYKHIVFLGEPLNVGGPIPEKSEYEVCVVRLDQRFISDDHRVLVHESDWCPHGYKYYFNQVI